MNSKRLELFISLYLGELTKAANAGLLPWARNLNQVEFETRITKITKDAALAFAHGRGSISSGPAIKAVVKQLKLKSAKAVTAWMFGD